MSTRQAALLLHALSTEDRDWMLDQLAAHEQSQVRQHLTELNSLGIPSDGAVVDAALAARRSTAPCVAPDDEALVLNSSAVELARVLEAEPTAFVHKLLACEAWPWREEVAALMSLPRREDPPAAQARSFRACALRHLAQRLRDNAAAVPAESATPDALPAAARPVLARLSRLWGARA